jgi:hypothetical protein
MALNLDISKLTQAAAMKATPHDNCIVLDLGTGSFPRDIEVRLPDDDGARQNALWDGSLNLSVNDEVICFEYSGISAWRIMGMGGNDGGAGKVRVSEVWSDDFTSVSLATDASDNVTINTGTLTLPSDVIHLGDPDTKWSFADDAVEVTVGGLSMLKLTETAQNLVEIGDVGGGGDVDVKINDDQIFIRGNDGRVGFSDTTLPSTYTFYHPTQSAVQLRTSSDSLSCVFIGQTSRGTKVSPSATTNNKLLMRFSGGGYDGSVFTDAQAAVDMYANQTFTAANQGTRMVFSTTANNDTLLTERMRIDDGGDVKIGPAGTPAAQLHIDQSSASTAQPVLLLDQADISEEMIEFATTIGVGNAIEAVGAKTLTPTHFIKVTLPGGLTRYFEVGTIA